VAAAKPTRQVMTMKKLLVIPASIAAVAVTACGGGQDTHTPLGAAKQFRTDTLAGHYDAACDRMTASSRAAMKMAGGFLDIEGDATCANTLAEIVKTYKREGKNAFGGSDDSGSAVKQDRVKKINDTHVQVWLAGTTNDESGITMVRGTTGEWLVEMGDDESNS
jgi:hypothetical protein